MGHREQLLAAARQLLEDKGYAHITARDLVAASGTNLASIGYHFGSKAGLLNAALGDGVRGVDHPADDRGDGRPGRVADRARAPGVGRAAGLATGRRALLVSFMEALAQADRDPELREQLAGDVPQHPRPGGRAGGRPRWTATADDPRCTAVASWVMAVCDGLSMQWLLDPASTPAGEHLLRGLADLRAISE